MATEHPHLPQWTADLTLAARALRRLERDLPADARTARWDLDVATTHLERVLSAATAPLRAPVPLATDRSLQVFTPRDVAAHTADPSNPRPAPELLLEPPGRLSTRTVRSLAHAQLRFWPNEWSLLDEVAERSAGLIGRRIDLLALRPAPDPSWGLFQRLAIEIKTSRNDFLTDLRAPDKQHMWRRLTHAHVYLAPAGLIRPHELPAESGLFEVFLARRTDDDPGMRVLRCTVEPPTLDPPAEPDWLLRDLMYRAAFHAWQQDRDGKSRPPACASEPARLSEAAPSTPDPRLAG